MDKTDIEISRVGQSQVVKLAEVDEMSKLSSNRVPEKEIKRKA